MELLTTMALMQCRLSALLFLALVGLVGCHKTPPNDVHTLFVGLASPPTTLDPRRATDAYSQRISDLLFSALVRMGPDLKPVGEAGAAWKTEKRKITFTLRRGLRF